MEPACSSSASAIVSPTRRSCTGRLCHRSWVAESDEEHSNERLEFLGDAVLGWVIADIVFRNFSDQPEGALTDLRKSVVNAYALAEVAAELHLGQHLLLGRGEDAAGGREKVSILSDAMEAVLGAVYLDGGSQVAFDLVDRLFSARLEAAIATLDRLDYKSTLQELTAHRGLPTPGVLGEVHRPRPRQDVLRRRHAGRPGRRRGRGPLEEVGGAGSGSGRVRPAHRRLTGDARAPRGRDRAAWARPVRGRPPHRTRRGRARAHGQAHLASGAHRRPDRRHDHRGPSPRQVPPTAARHRRRDDDPSPHERPGPVGCGRRAASGAHARGAAPRRRDRVVVRRPAHVRRGGGVRPRPRGGRGARARLARRRRDVARAHAPGVARVGAAEAAPDQTVAARPARDRRDRQHLRRRDPAPVATAARSGVRCPRHRR